MAFGNFPLAITISEDGQSVTLASVDVPTVVEAGITAVFDLARLPIMQARAAAFGYTLVVQEPMKPAAPAAQTRIGG